MKRGGSWGNDARNCRAAYRNRDEPENRDENLGFRVARAPHAAADAQPDGPGRSPVPPTAGKIPNRVAPCW
ncbi:MAG: hypothetical protein NTY19_33070 [Planctomycetota bacterium]|nr:hypothetical protein [Planctomycetota bacterium]